MNTDNTRARSGPKHVHPPPVGDTGTTNRVGWGNKSLPSICYGCYERGHILPECKLGITDFSKVIANYEQLTADERTHIPDTYYQRAIGLVKRNPERKVTEDVKQAEEPKN